MLSSASTNGTRWPDFIGYVTDNGSDWEANGTPPADLMARLGNSGFLHQRWESGRREGLRSALELIGAVAPLNGGVALAISLHSEVFIAGLQRFRRNECAASLIPAALRGEVVGALAITEDGGGSDPARSSCVAEESPDGTWHVAGHKRFISNLDLATHALLLTNASGATHSGPTLFILDLSLDGVEAIGRYDKMGTRSVNAWRLGIDTELPAGARLGPVGAGLAGLLPCLRHERMAVSRAVLSGAAHSLELSNAYLRQRQGANGRMYDHSALAHTAARCAIELEAAEALLERVILRDLARRATDADFAALKYFCATTANGVADAALQLMGGRGYTSNFPHERILRDARLSRIGAGTDELMLEIVARALDRSSPCDRELSELMEMDQPTVGAES